MCTSGTKSVLLYASHMLPGQYSTQKPIIVINVALAQKCVYHLLLQILLSLIPIRHANLPFHDRHFGCLGCVEAGSAIRCNLVVGYNSIPEIGIGKRDLF